MSSVTRPRSVRKHCAWPWTTSTKHPSDYAAANAIGPMVDVHPETLRVWILKAKASDAAPAGRPASTPVPSIEREELERLRRENRELKQANEILKLASAFFARELDPRHR